MANQIFSFAKNTTAFWHLCARDLAQWVIDRCKRGGTESGKSGDQSYSRLFVLRGFVVSLDSPLNILNVNDKTRFVYFTKTCLMFDRSY